MLQSHKPSVHLWQTCSGIMRLEEVEFANQSSGSESLILRRPPSSPPGWRIKAVKTVAPSESKFAFILKFKFQFRRAGRLHGPADRSD